jgi:hypothetical protein
MSSAVALRTDIVSRIHRDCLPTEVGMLLNHLRSGSQIDGTVVKKGIMMQIHHQ